MSTSFLKGYLILYPHAQKPAVYIPGLTKGAARTLRTVHLGHASSRFRVPVQTRPPSSSAHAIKILIQSTEQGWKAGPLMGILTVRGNRSFRGNRNNYKDLVQTGKKKGTLVYVIPSEDIDWNRNQTRGYVYDDRRKQWISLQMPLPDVIYNRIPYRQFEHRNDIQKTLERLKTLPQLSLFNPGFFNKWELYRTLSHSPETASFLPETAVLSSRQVLKDFAGKYPLIYIKPVSGKAGKGIMRLHRNRQGYHLQYQSQGDTITRTFSQLDGAWKAIHALTRNESYIIQQGIPLLKHRGSPFDVRVLVQKNGKGKWTVAGIGIRVAGQNGITTHVPRGGSIANPRHVLALCFGKDQTGTLLKEIEKKALRLVHYLDLMKGPLGEASMDLGIDRNRNIWFFEANAKPMKFDEPDIRRRSLHNLIAYCKHLSGFSRSTSATYAGER
ncbi:MAG: YheC/YheD family protein [Bacillaceae bacterium]|nr:YheC/YheD family protein [Bacillaceae bacterium]